MMGGSWQAPGVEHVFASGRTAVLREHLPLHVLVRAAATDGDLDLMAALKAWDAGELDDPVAALRLQDAMVRAMFLRPRIAPEGIEPSDLGDAISIDELDDEDLNEVVTLAMKGVAEAARFRRDGDGASGGKNGASVGKGAKRGARPAGGKRSGASAGR